MDQRSRPSVSIPSSRFTLGVVAFERISAVEGLAPTPDLIDADREMARLCLTGEQRLDFLKARYGRQHGDR